MNTSMKSDPSTPVLENVRRFMRRHPLASFFLIAYASSWIVSIPFVLSEWGILRGDFKVVFAIKSFGPFLAAYLMARVIDGKEGVLRLRRRITQKQAGWQWYLFILLGIPVLVMLGVLIQPGTTAGFKGLTPVLLVSYPVAYVAVCFGGGPLGEEPGWRGFALPRMQQRYGPLWGTLLLAVVWTGWHLPDFLTSAQGGGPGTGFSTFLHNFPVFFGLVTAIAVILTWVYNHTHESLFTAILAHASVNTPQVVLIPLFPAVDATRLNLAALIGFGVPAILIIVLTRGQLGHRRTEGQP